jgi:hypothetical protein
MFLIWLCVYTHFPVVVVVLSFCSGAICRWPNKRVKTCIVMTTYANKNECWHSSVYFALLWKVVVYTDHDKHYLADTQQDAYHKKCCEKSLKLGHDCFLSYPFQFIINSHQVISFHSVQSKLLTASVNQQQIIVSFNSYLSWTQLTGPKANYKVTSYKENGTQKQKEMMIMIIIIIIKNY